MIDPNKLVLSTAAIMLLSRLARGVATAPSAIAARQTGKRSRCHLKLIEANRDTIAFHHASVRPVTPPITGR